MAFHWRRDNPLTFPNDFGENGFRLPKYVVIYMHCVALSSSLMTHSIARTGII
jgi:hypothetical protein